MIEETHDRLKQAREAAGFETAEVAGAALGIPASTYRSLENGTRGLSKEHALKIAKKYKVSPAWLFFGDEYSVEHIKPKSGTKIPRIDNAVYSTREEHSARVNELDVRAGAGPGGVLEAIDSHDGMGALVTSDALLGHWSMPDYFTRGTLRIDPAKAIVMEIFGDSGYDPSNPHAPGSFFPGDRLIIDTSDTRPSPPGAFAVYDGFGIVVKLVEPMPGSDPPRIRLSSRNPQYAPYEIALRDGDQMGEGHILGRVRGRISPM